MQYTCERDCWGFRNTLWKKGEVVNVTAEEEKTIPYHFRPLSGEVTGKKEPLYEPIALSELNKPVQPKGGLAASVAEANPVIDNKTLKPKVGRPKRK